MPQWMTRGLCRGADPQIFDGDPLHDETAKEFCRRCPVKNECRQYGIENSGQVVGVWGGLNDDERRAQKRGGDRKRCPGCRGERILDVGYSEICLSCGLSWKS